MKNAIVFLFIVLFYSCNKINDGNTIRIKSKDLENKLVQFNEDAKLYAQNTDNNVSVAFWKDHNEIRIGFYSSKKLKAQDYLGKTNVEKLNVYFYSNDESSYRDLIDIEYNTKEIKNIKDVSHTYSCFYVYKKQKLELISSH